jgi:hypothetical protein
MGRRREWYNNTKGTKDWDTKWIATIELKRAFTLVNIALIRMLALYVQITLKQFS